MSAPKVSKPVLALLAIVFVLVVFAVWLRLFVVEQKPTGATKIGSQAYTLEIANSKSEQVKGLSGRASIGENEGMLFLFLTNEEHCFWMKDTNFALDIIWLNAQQNVTHIYENITPDTYPRSFCSGEDGRFGIELPAGSVEESGLQVGHSVDLFGNFKAL